jgi:hypothetical protein
MNGADAFRAGSCARVSAQPIGRVRGRDRSARRELPVRSTYTLAEGFWPAPPRQWPGPSPGGPHSAVGLSILAGFLLAAEGTVRRTRPRPVGREQLPVPAVWLAVDRDGEDFERRHASLPEQGTEREAGSEREAVLVLRTPGWLCSRAPTSAKRLLPSCGTRVNWSLGWD